MDPDMTLSNIRLTAGLIQYAMEVGNKPDAEQVADLLEMVAALDGWLSSGGYRPAKWIQVA